MLGHAVAVSRATPGPGTPMVDPPVASIAYLGKKAPQLRHIPVATPPDSWILAPPPCTPSFFSRLLFHLGYDRGVLGDRTNDFIDCDLPAVIRRSDGSDDTFIPCHNGRLCRWVSRQIRYD